MDEPRDVIRKFRIAHTSDHYGVLGLSTPPNGREVIPLILVRCEEGLSVYPGSPTADVAAVDEMHIRVIIFGKCTCDP